LGEILFIALIFFSKSYSAPQTSQAAGRDVDISIENSPFRRECDEKIAAHVWPKAYEFDARAMTADFITETDH
jgi:hypothetical protein